MSGSPLSLAATQSAYSRTESGSEETAAVLQALAFVAVVTPLCVCG